MCPLLCTSKKLLFNSKEEKEETNRQSSYQLRWGKDNIKTRKRQYRKWALQNKIPLKMVEINKPGQGLVYKGQRLILKFNQAAVLQSK